jgi:hypothetical protein
VKVSERRLLAACIKLKKARVVVTRINPNEYKFKKEFLLKLEAETSSFEIRPDYNL